MHFKEQHATPCVWQWIYSCVSCYICKWPSFCRISPFCAKNQYHGGTNFGRTAAAFMITGYYDQAPLDEYGKLSRNLRHHSSRLLQVKVQPLIIYAHALVLGLIRQPKWSHLKELHASVKSISQPLLYGTSSTFPLGKYGQVRTFLYLMSMFFS